MKKNRIKLTAPVLRTRAEMESMMGEIRSLTIERNERQLEREARLKQVDDAHAEVLAGLEKALQEKTELVRTWAEGNESEFDGRKSLETAHGVIGWRTGQPTLKTLAGWTWDRVLERIKSLKALGHYVRAKEEVNKQAILSDREGMGPDALRAIGLKVIQEEPFYVEPRLEETENRRESEAA